MTEDTGAIDPMAMARFLVLPGAARLLEAFASIPPGPMRDAVIHLAETTASTYTGAPAHHRMPDPLRAIGAGSSDNLRLTNTGRRAPPMGDTLESRIIELRMEGLTPAVIAHQLNCSAHQVYQACTKAKKAGVPIPGRELKGTREAKRWTTRFEDLSAQGMAMTTKAAETRGITAQQYLDRRQLALEMAMGGAHYEAITEATGEADSKVISAWLSVARAAGHEVPYITHSDADDAEPDAPPVAEPEAELEPFQDAEILGAARVFPPASNLALGAEKAMRGAAERRNMTLQAYEDLRESIVQHRLAAKTPTAIAQLTGEPITFVKDTLAKASQDYGVVFPPITLADLEAPVIVTPEAASA